MVRVVIPPVLLTALLLLGLALDELYPLRILVYYPWSLAGGVLVLAGMVVAFWAEILFKKFRTPIRPAAAPLVLVREGPFAFSRNPMYVGMVLVLMGWAVFLGSLTPWLCPVALWCIMHAIYIPYEEKICQEAFGQRYRDYQAKVRRWL